MTPWPFWETFDVRVIGQRLGMMLIGITAYSIVVAIVIRVWDIRILEGGSAASAINTLILGLLLSFRNGAAYSRWWEARGLWGQLINDSRNLAAKLAAFLPAELLARARVAELLSGFAEALNRHLRDQMPRLRDLPGLERETDDPPHVPLYIARRLYSCLADWKKAGQVDGALLWILDAHLRGLMDVCGACEKIRFTPLTPSYKMLLRIGLLLNIVAEPWLTIPEVGLWGLPVFLLVCVFLLGIELIDSVVEEPFGCERDDLDLDRYCRTIRDGVRASLPFADPLVGSESFHELR
jgi:putative membrane protein